MLISKNHEFEKAFTWQFNDVRENMMHYWVICYVLEDVKIIIQFDQNWFVRKKLESSSQITEIAEQEQIQEKKKKKATLSFLL